MALRNEIEKLRRDLALVRREMLIVQQEIQEILSNADGRNLTFKLQDLRQREQSLVQTLTAIGHAETGQS
ncbi:MAG: hypothetical protein EKK41_02790 [Hyphomicrobiales bacterium]|nr:MAG: hypothetical protein EKK41_02790 [Hyphomicrobiales bacterium]